MLDVCIIEVGLGGLYDATNVFRPSTVLACVITSIGLDHVKQLGSTIESVATHKAGILKPGISAQSPIHNIEKIEIVESAGWSNVEIKDSESVYQPHRPAEVYDDFGWCEVEVLRGGGKARIENFATEIRTLCVIGRSQKLIGFRISERKFSKELELVRWRGRLEWVRVGSGFDGNEPVLVDGAHNVAAAVELRIKSIILNKQDLHGEVRKGVFWVFGASEGKEIDNVLKQLVSDEDVVCPFTFSTPEGMPWVQSVDRTKVENSLKSIDFKGKLYASIEIKELLDNIRMQVNVWPRPELIVVCGSLYLVSDFLRELKKSTTMY
ncbi:folylpolyglutamate synthase [Nowakowskiella sp. JEL0407]|nr:folylpolyglutamate synthase [Nowakowskiella sp. JEL0407]